MTKRTAGSRAAVAALLVAFGATSQAHSATSPGVIYRSSGVVLQVDQTSAGGFPAHGPQLCFGVLLSNPPQCGGPDLVGWDWTAAEGHETKSATTWGGPYVTEGTYDGSRITLTAKPRLETAGDRPPLQSGREIFATPCPRPKGGWIPKRKSRGFPKLRTEAIKYARSLADFSVQWPDYRPDHVVLNVRFAANVAKHRAELRARYPGNLCVVGGGHRRSMMDRANRALLSIKGFLSGGQDSTGGFVNANVLFDDGSIQTRLDREFGEGVVHVHSQLTPIAATSDPLP